MDAIFGSVLTVLAVLSFVGIVYWAYSGRRKNAFRDAANAPFAVPDELERRPMTDGGGPASGVLR